MEDWGVHVAADEIYCVVIPQGKALHLSVATLLEPISRKSTVYTYSQQEKGKNKHTLVCLTSRTPSVSIGVVYSKTFYLSHSSKDAAVSFSGFMADDPTYDSDSGKKKDMGSTSGASQKRIKRDVLQIHYWDDKKGSFHCNYCSKILRSMIAVELHLTAKHPELI